MRVKLTPVRRGDPRTITVTIQDVDSDPIDLSGSTWTSTVRALANSTTGQELTVDVTQAASGVLGLHLTGEQSRLLGNTFVGDLQGSMLGTVLEFYGIVRDDATHPGVEPGSGLVDNVTLTWGGAAGTLSSSVLAILVSPGAGTLVHSSEIRTIKRLTQVEYDALVPEETTFYVITG